MYGRCEGCYQLLGVDLVYNSTFHPAVLEISGQPDLTVLPSLQHHIQPALDQPAPAPVTTHTLGRIQVAKDVLTVLHKDVQVAEQLHEMLIEGTENLGEYLFIYCQILYSLRSKQIPSKYCTILLF